MNLSTSFCYINTNWTAQWLVSNTSGLVFIDNTSTFGLLTSPVCDCRANDTSHYYGMPINIKPRIYFKLFKTSINITNWLNLVYLNIII